MPLRRSEACSVPYRNIDVTNNIHSGIRARLMRRILRGDHGRADTELQREAGFTLLELLVVIVIIGLLIGLVAPAALRQLGGARVSITKQSIERLGSILDMYKLDVGSYPSTSDGLEALVAKPTDADNWNGPYVKAENGLLDPWRHPYIYRSPSQRDGHDYDICSLGPNGQQGSGDTSGMICNP